MGKNSLFIAGIAVWCFLAFSAGCASSELVDIWSDPSFHPPSLNKMLVISASKNSALRRIWEDDFSSELAKHNVAATPSYRVFPDAVPDTNQVSSIVQSTGFDGVIITRWLPAETTTEYVQEYMTSEQTVRYSYSRDRFITYYRDIVHPAHIDSQKVANRAIDVWSIKNDGQLIWSARSTTPEPKIVHSTRLEIIKLVMSELAHRGIIASKR